MNYIHYPSYDLVNKKVKEFDSASKDIYDFIDSYPDFTNKNGLNSLIFRI